MKLCIQNTWIKVSDAWLTALSSSNICSFSVIDLFLHLVVFCCKLWGKYITDGANYWCKLCIELCLCVLLFSLNIFLSSASPCDSYPCLHGGTCLSQGNGNFECECASGYAGLLCDESEFHNGLYSNCSGKINLMLDISGQKKVKYACANMVCLYSHIK